MPSRPDRLVFVTGTGTEVGKTWIGSRVLAQLAAAGQRVAARKPAESFEPDAAITDANFLGAATDEPATVVCPPHRHYPAALAPPMAAEALGLPSFTIDDLAAEITWPDGIAVGLVEGAGGLRSPLAADGDNLDLLGRLDPDVVVVVADAGLGTINSVRLTVDALTGAGGRAPIVVVLNRVEAAGGVGARNLAWLRDRDGHDVVTTPAEIANRLTPAG
jgi:dethiobiotin synthetase